MPIVNAGISPQLFDYLVKSMTDSPFYKLMEIKITLLGEGQAELEVQAQEKHTNPIGLVHGGLIMSMADAAMGNAIRSIGVIGVTVDCSVSFPGSARLGEKLLARGKVIKAGHKMIFAEATVWAGERILGHSKSTFFNTGKIELT
ncbi:MAG TPA: PaaI family thioesterase [Syntrophomonas sp.]|nr:PaaI family thioesterase [Syntrophomonas sp.]HRW12992.1 PaaI family thioesterase [Syntrophomonas sp.]